MKNVKEDLTGKKFNHLTVIKRVEDKITSSGYVKDMWLTQCDCGLNTKVVAGAELKSGHTKSCGCVRSRPNGLMKVKRDMVGEKFGNLTIIKRANYDYIYPNGNHDSIWIANCDCGSKNIEVRYSHLISGNNKSCGCLLKDARKRNGSLRKKYNTYDLSGEYGIGYTDKGEEFWFDLEDYDKIKDYCWYYCQGYLRSNIYDDINKKQSHIVLHRLVMGFPDGKEVDHIVHPDKYGNKFDNRKSNLRIVNKSENQMNKSMQQNNKSGVVGVSWHSRDNCWSVSIGYYGKDIYIGSYYNFEDAVNARRDAENKYFGEYSFINSGNQYEEGEIE